MLVCIACSKQLNASGSYQEQQVVDDEVGTPSAKHSIKSLTAHIKDMDVKASGAYKNCKPCSGSSCSQAYAESEATSTSGGFYGSYIIAESSNSIPGQWGKEMDSRPMDSRPKGISSCEGTPVSVSGRVVAAVFLEDDEPKEWVAQADPGVLITFLSLPQGGNNLKKIQFSREMFNKWEAQRWWGQNYEKIMELYNVQRSTRQAGPPQASPKSDDERSRVESVESNPAIPSLTEERLPHNFHHPMMKPSSGFHESARPTPAVKLPTINPSRTEATSHSASARTSASHESNYSGDLSASNASEDENEWVEQDEPGVYITLRALPGGIRELRRVRFSREKFGEVHARVWWEANRARIQERYLR